MKKFLVIGNPIEHSLSPKLHNYWIKNNKIDAVYDKKFGWTKDQHLGKEFYGDFGTFDVELTFASNFVFSRSFLMSDRVNRMVFKTLKLQNKIIYLRAVES